MKNLPILNQAPATESLECMEIFGGNRVTSKRLELPGLDVWLISQPYEEADRGGDVHFVSSCASGRISRILLADISGHGEEVAEMGQRLRDLMRDNINVVRQTKFVQQMNEQFASVSKDESFATAVVCSYFEPTRTLEISNAGHPRPLFYSNATKTWTAITQQSELHASADDTPLGVIDDANYSGVKIKVAEGDMLFSYSDALIESELGKDGEALGVDGLKSAIEKLPADEPETLLRKLFEGLVQHHPQNLSQDDVTVILTRVSKPTYSFTKNLLAPFRLFGQVKDKTDLDSPTGKT